MKVPLECNGFATPVLFAWLTQTNTHHRSGVRWPPDSTTGAFNKPMPQELISGRGSLKFRPSREFLAASQHPERLVKVCRQTFFCQS